MEICEAVSGLVVREGQNRFNLTYACLQTMETGLAIPQFWAVLLRPFGEASNPHKSDLVPLNLVRTKTD